MLRRSGVHAAQHGNVAPRVHAAALVAAAPTSLAAVQLPGSGGAHEAGHRLLHAVLAIIGAFATSPNYN